MPATSCPKSVLVSNNKYRCIWPGSSFQIVLETGACCVEGDRSDCQPEASSIA